MQDIGEALTNSLDRDGKGGMRANLNMGGFRATNAADGTSPSDLATVGQASVPVGSVIDYAGSTAPTGYLMCYGQAVSRTDYSALFAVLGTTYGSGDFTTTFNVPDARGRTTAGKDNMGGTAASRLTGSVTGSTLGAVGGEEAHSLTIGEMPAHDHGGNTGPGSPHSHSVPFFLSSPGGAQQGASLTSGTQGAVPTTDEASHTHPIPSQGGGAAHNTVQPTIVFNKIIKAGNS